MLAYSLADAEGDLRNTYWQIRAKRHGTTNWKAVNNVRYITMAMERMGVTKAEIKAAMYCLRTPDCRRCNKNGGAGFIACFFIEKRRKAGMQWK